MTQDGDAVPASPRPTRRALFVDRDGTLNPDLRYLGDPERLEVFRGVAQGLRWMRANGYLVLCVTNQSGIERGFYTAADVERIHARLNARLRDAETQVDGFYYCPHAPETHCPCRKPGTELFLRARADWGVDLGRSAIVGDRALDVQAGERLGLRTAVVVPPGHTEEVKRELASEHLVPDLLAFSFSSACRRLLRAG